MHDSYFAWESGAHKLVNGKEWKMPIRFDPALVCSSRSCSVMPTQDQR
jgi:hypothetical protein